MKAKADQESEESDKWLSDIPVTLSIEVKYH